MSLPHITPETRPIDVVIGLLQGSTIFVENDKGEVEAEVFFDTVKGKFIFDFRGVCQTHVHQPPARMVVPAGFARDSRPQGVGGCQKWHVEPFQREFDDFNDLLFWMALVGNEWSQ